MGKSLIDKTVKYDQFGRMKAHPVYHPQSGKPWTQGELVYLCKFYEFDGLQTISYGLGRAETACAKKVSDLRVEGIFRKYKYWEGDY